MQITPVVKQLLIINIIVFIGSWALGPQIFTTLSLYFFENDKFQFWQIITYMFMHGGVMHIAFNMFALYSFGSALEYFWGGEKFLFFYISCGIGAALLHMGINYYELQQILDQLSSLNFSKEDLHILLNADYKTLFDTNGQMIAGKVKAILDNANCSQEQFNTLAQAVGIVQSPMVGASGAIYGLLVAFAFMVPNAELALLFIPVPIKAKYFVPGLLLLDLFLGLKGNSIFGGGTGIAHFAHIGGALVGFLMMWYWKKTSFNNNRWN